MSHGRSIYGNISNQMMIGFIFWGLPFALLCLFVNISIAITTISPSQALRDINGDTLVSDGESFELGFFSPGSSNKNRYLGIWYKKIPVQTVVWVANRPNPITDSSGVLKVDDKGNLTLLNQTDNVIWSSSSSSASHEAQSPVVKLLDTGNLVLVDNKGAGNSEAYLWQSFDYPSDTFLPGMKLGWNLKTGLNRVLTSWKSFDDPSPGELTHGIDPHGYPEAFIWKGTVKIFRSGPWNGFRYSGGPEMRHNTIFNFSFIYNGEEVYSMYQSNDNYKLTRVVLNQTNDNDLLRRYTWVEHTQTWQQLSATLPKDGCDTYGQCGPYGNCDIDKLPICQCLKGFKPKSLSIDGSHGCDRKTPLSSKKDGFLKFSGLKLPDTTHSWVSKSMSLKECKAECLKNCSCVAYARADIRGAGSGCALWYGDLIDIRQISVSEQDLYVRVAASELGSESARKIKKYVLIIANVIICGILLLGICGWYIRKSKMKPKGDQESNEANDNNNGSHTDDLELPMYDTLIISIATDNFSDSNKLGEGGFGPVYKGKLSEGHEIAVKKLSKYSVQGMHEFRNEVILISKLQHRNLVRLLGCCIQGDEKMLIYEYMPNKSLDSFIFDNTKRKILDWQKRFNIILGVARGLLYLHQDSRLRVIHRDMKASNVLLDSNMDPKISDFGMARIFGGEHFEASTNRVVGTYGYMPPEYLMDGHFSVKSDIFSFGVLVLEIVSGTRNKGFYHSDHQHNLLGHAWKLWIEGKALELIDASISDSCPESDVIRCVHVGLLCVQQRADDRPTMSTVVLMLSSESTMLPKPKQPGFFTERYPMEANSWDTSSKQESASSNNLTITSIEGR